MKIFWGSRVDDRLIGGYYGYRVHNETLLKYTSMREDTEIVDKEEDADVSLFITTPETFDPPRTKPTFLFTMFEGLEIPKPYLDNLYKADYLIVPSHWVKTLFDRHFDPKKVFVVPHGVEEIFRYKERKPHPKHFRFLWVGAANPRKGYQEVILLWTRMGFQYDPSVELYIKTTRVPDVIIQQCRNVILDARNVSKRELVTIYHSAHCFLFPTRGEGFGLTLAEALATGLPCIATNWSGHTEFFDDSVGYTIGFDFGDSPVKSPSYGDLGITKMAFPNVEDLLIAMSDVRKNYGLALLKAKRGSIRIKSSFTWDQSAEKLIQALRHGVN